jgi:hypothetical protein
MAGDLKVGVNCMNIPVANGQTVAGGKQAAQAGHRREQLGAFLCGAF